MNVFTCNGKYQSTVISDCVLESTKVLKGEIILSTVQVYTSDTILITLSGNQMPQHIPCSENYICTYIKLKI